VKVKKEESNEPDYDQDEEQLKEEARDYNCSYNNHMF